MPSLELLKTLSSYVPALITHRLTEDTTPITKPVADSLFGSILVADISGFNSLTEQFAQRGGRGAEDLARLLNLYFDELINLITTHGGDIIKLSSDTLFALWPATAKTDLPEVTLRATQCALQLQKKLGHYVVMKETSLNLKLMLGTGKLVACHLGGIYGRWEFCIAGPLLGQIEMAQNWATPGNIVLSPQVWALLKDKGQGHLLDKGYVKLETISQPLPIQSLKRPLLPVTAEIALSAYIPGAIITRLAAGQSGWLADLRYVTVIFLHLPTINHKTPLKTAQELMCKLQTAVYHHEGSVNKVIAGNKGTSMLAALGLPPLAHEDDGIRGVKAALSMKETLSKLNVEGAIGVATGLIFCGSVGNKERCEFTIMGDTVDLATQLMQTAVQKRDTLAEDNKKTTDCLILCDEATYQAAQSQINFQTLPSIQIKDKNKSISVYQPTNILMDEAQNLSAKTKSPMVGRHNERMLLADRLQLFLRGTGGIIIIEGVAGIGKSRLVDDLLRQAQDQNVGCMMGMGHALERTTPYYPWRNIFKQVLGLDQIPVKAHRQLITKKIKFKPELLSLAPLLGVVLPISWPDNNLTAEMSGQVRADNINYLLIELLKNAMAEVPQLLIIDDAHWLDSASWTLLWQISHKIPDLLVVVALRPLADPFPPEYYYLLNLANTQRIALKPLPPDDTLTFISQQLGVSDLPQPMINLLTTKAKGNPFFGEELAYSLRDANLIEIIDGKCQITPKAGNLIEITLPDTVQGLILDRINHLSQQQQLTLKVASIIGRIFSFNTLYQVYPIQIDKSELREHLITLEELDITPVETSKRELSYIFKHIITHEVAYRLTSPNQRQQIHAAVANWIKNTYTANPSVHYSQLARHYQEALDSQNPQVDLINQTLHYSNKAGEQALHNGAYQDAVHFFTLILSLAKSQQTITWAQLENPNIKKLNIAWDKAQESKINLAYWHRLLGKAYFGLKQYPHSQTHYHQVLSLLDKPIPTTQMALIRGLLKLVWHQFWSFGKLSKLQTKSSISFSILEGVSLEKDNLKEVTSEIALEIAKAYQQLKEFYKLDNNILSANYATFYGLSMAQIHGISPELACYQVCIAVIYQSYHLNALAKIYYHKAKKMASKLAYHPTQAYVAFTFATNQIGFSPWEQIQEAAQESVSLYKQTKDRNRWGMALEMLGWVFYLQSQFKVSLKTYQDLYNLGLKNENAQHQIAGLNGQALALLYLGQTATALNFLTKASLLLKHVSKNDKEQCLNSSFMALAYLQQGQMEQAEQFAQTAYTLISASSPNFYCLDAYSSTIQVYFALWEQAILNKEKLKQLSLKKTTQKLCEQLHKLAKINPIAQVLALLYQGNFYKLSKKPRLAYRQWQKGLKLAKKLNLPYQQGLFHYQLGQHLSSSTTQQKHLKQATEIFQQLEIIYPLTNKG